MAVKDSMRATGRLSITLTDENGRVKDTRQVENLVVNTGLGHITSRMTGVSSGVMSHMALGAGTTAAAAANTAMESALGSRKAFDSATVSGSANETITYVTTFSPGEGTGAVTEAGIFNAATVGTMLCRTVFGVITKAAGDTLVITWTLTLAAA